MDETTRFRFDVTCGRCGQLVCSELLRGAETFEKYTPIADFWRKQALAHRCQMQRGRDPWAIAGEHSDPSNSRHPMNS